MKVMVLGIGLQGKAVLHDLSKAATIDEIVAMDIDISGALKFTRGGSYHKVRCIQGDGSDQAGLVSSIKKTKVDLLICMLPSRMGSHIAKACIEAAVPFVSTDYAKEYGHLHAKARSKGVLLMPEMGFDPGIDLIIGAKVVAELDEVHGLNSYGSGVPEPEACDNPINYKISWTFDGVLNAYTRPAHIIKEGRKREVSGADIFNEALVHTIDIPELGTMEAYLNGDAVRFAGIYNLGPELKEMGRYTTRWPGHCAFWRTMSRLGFLDEDPVDMGNGVSLAPRTFLCRHLSPRLQYKKNERDIAFLRVHAWGLKNGEQKSIIYELVDYRDLETGFFAMNRTVGYTASIAAQLILKGDISGSGLLSPARDVDPDLIIPELAERGIRITRRLVA